MNTLLQLLALFAVIVGTIFSMLGVLGYLRLPDVYTRLHATGKVGVFGAVLLLLAAVAWTPLSLGKALVLAAGCGILGSYLGLVASFRWDLPAGPAIALALALPYLASLFLAPHGFLRRRSPRKQHLEN